MKPSKSNIINELFAQWRESGNADAEVRLASELEKLARTIILHLLRESDPALAQRAVEKALTHAGQFRGESQFSTWFYTIVARLCWDELRKRQKRREVSLEELSVEEIESLSLSPSNDAKLELEQLSRNLGEADRQLLAWKLEGYTDPEIANLLGCSVNAAKLRWLKLRRKLASEARPSCATDSCPLPALGDCKGLDNRERDTSPP